MQQRSPYFPIPVHLTALAVTGGLLMAAIAAITSPDRVGANGKFERELAAISERSEEIAAFERNIRPVHFDASDNRAVPFAGFLKSAAHLKPGRHLSLARSHANDAKLEVLDVRRITQTANVTRPAALKMNLLLVKGRLIDATESGDDHILHRDGLDADERIVHLLFAVGEPVDAKPSGLTLPLSQHSL